MRDDINRAMKRGEVTIAVLADFSKAFDTFRFRSIIILRKLHLQLGFSSPNVEVDEADRDSGLTILEDPSSKIITYRFCRVVFGLDASPFLLNATLRHISKYIRSFPFQVKF